MFTFREKFVASDAWMRLWLLGSLAFALWLLIRALEPSLSALSSPGFLLLTVLAFAATTVLTLVLSPIVAVAVFDGKIERQTRRNGGPFAIGDRVVIIPGRHAGRAGRISSYGQSQALRVTLDGEDAEHGSYSHYQLKRTGEEAGTHDAVPRADSERHTRVPRA